MRLYGKPPARIFKTIPKSCLLMGGFICIVQRLQAKDIKIQIHKVFGRVLRLRIDEFYSCPSRCKRGASAFGETQIQSSPAGALTVPFVSTATLKPAAWKASIKSVSSCSSGSPPVQTTHFCPPLGQCLPAASTKLAAVLNLPPLGPSVPIKSVSQNLQTASARAGSSPLQRLHPAKRKNTAGNPVCAPSP